MDTVPTALGWRLASFALEGGELLGTGLATQTEIWDAYCEWCAKRDEEPIALAFFDQQWAGVAEAAGLERVQNGANVYFGGRWDAKKLHQLAEERGESIPKDPLVENALLAQERFMGRAERSYDRDRARLELNRLVDRIEEFPRAQQGEFPAVKQLRAYAEERAVQLNAQRKVEEQDQGKAPSLPHPEHAPSVAEREEEDDLEMGN